MPTTRGWAAIGVSLALLGLWAAFGEIELLATATFLIAALIAGIAFVRILAPSVTLIRRLSPAQVHEGDHVTVDLSITARHHIRNLSLEDTVHGLGIAHFAAARVRSRSPVLARYEVLCRSRGAYQVGPVEAAVTDPFALAERRTTTGAIDRLLVYPRIEQLSGFPAVRGHDPAMQSTRPTFATQGGEDFFTLRAYQIGDDLRRIHWPSSAKRDELMIKQLEVPWQARALVLLDLRAAPYPSPESFEQAVRGAASVISHLYHNGFSPELWTGERIPGSRSGNRYTESMDILATVQPNAGLDLAAAVGRLRRSDSGGGALVMITGVVDEDAAAAYRLLARDFARTVVMAVAHRTPATLRGLQRVGAVTVTVPPDGSWGPAWRTAMEMSWASASAG